MRSSHFCISKKLVVYSAVILFFFGTIVLLSNYLLKQKRLVNSRASTMTEQALTAGDIDGAIRIIQYKWIDASNEEKESIIKLARGAGIDCPTSDWGEYFTCLLGKRFGEGSVVQRYAVFQRLELTMGFNPTSSDKRALFVPWIKFNGAEEYAKQTQMFLVAKTLGHFLYGNGEALNISDDFKSVLLNPKNKYVVSSQDRSVPYLVGDMISRTLDYRGNLNVNNVEQRPFTISGDVTLLADAIRNNRPAHFKAELVTRSNPDEEDLINSLNQFTMYVEGDVVNSVKKQGSTKKNYGGVYYEVTLANPVVSLYDRYDWRAGTGFGAEGDFQTMANGLLRNLGVDDPAETITKIFGKDGYEALRHQTVRIDDSDGALLSLYKFGKEYDITGSIDVGDRLQFNISDETLRKAESDKLIP